MPKELTHWILSERVLAALPEESSLRRTILQHRNAYLGGAVLPDTLAHVFKGPFHPTARQLGQRFHDTAGSSYAPLIAAERRLAGAIPAPLFCCCLGVISHIEADAALHPYVYAATGNAGIGEHYRIETAIDLHFLRRGMAPRHRRLDRLLCDSTREAMLAAAALLFDPEGQLPRGALEHSLELHCRFQAMYDRTLWKISVRLLGRLCGSPFQEQRHLFYPLLKLRKRQWEADETREWHHPESGELKRASLEELARDAVERTVKVLLLIEEKGSFAAALEDHPGANLLTGLHGVKKKT